MILLDTHALVWCATGDTTKMSGARMEQIDAAIIEGQAAVSAVTFWELELFRRKPDNSSLRLPPTANLRLPPTANLRLRLLSDGLQEIAPTGDLMVRAVQLGDEGFHKDPMDRIIVATALQGGLRLATADAQIIDWANHTGHLELFDLQRD